jgi:pyruvate formate lyase activating enzyme
MRCGKCVDACPTGALSACGESKTVEEVFREIKKDEHYYKARGGGVTLSGGECLLQADFCLELLRKCKEEGIHTAIESALYVDYGQVEKVLPYVDFFYADLKLADSEKHKLYTGQGNELVIDNIRRLSQEGVPIVIRIPVIPTVNDGEEDMRAVGRVILGFSDGIKGIELLRYNPLASSKYKSVGKNYRAFATEPQSDMEMGVLKEWLQTEIGERFPVFFN